MIIMIFFSFVFAQNQYCGKSNESKEIFDIDKKVELLFFYKKDSSEEARRNFYENVLNKPVDGGHWPREGVQALFGIDRSGYEGFGITFRPEATRAQREEIKKILTESPLIYKVYENVLPTAITDL